MAATRDSDLERSGEAIRKSSAALEAMEHSVTHLRAEVAMRAEESNRCDLEIRTRLSDMQAECDAIKRYPAS